MRKLWQLARHLHGDSKAASLVEFAVVLPVMSILAFGGLEVGNYMYREHLIVNGVRDAARYAAGLPYDSTNSTQIATVKAAAKNIATRGVNTGGTNRVGWWSPSNVTVTYSTVANPNTCGSGGGSACYRYDGAVPVVTVSTSVAYSSLGFMAIIGLNAITITSSHAERVIGVR